MNIGERHEKRYKKSKGKYVSKFLAAVLAGALLLNSMPISAFDVSATTTNDTSISDSSITDLDDSVNTVVTDTYATWTEVAKAAVRGVDYTVAGYEITISTAKGLAWLAYETNKDSYGGFQDYTVTLTADIDLATAGVSDYNEKDVNSTNSWIAIGQSLTSFQGTFDGGEHTVSGVYINTSSNYQGLFGYVVDGTIKNVGVIESSITSTSTNNYVGGVVGYSISTVENCYNTGDVTGSGEYVGGVVGYTEGTVENCYNTGGVTGSYYVGGVVGRSSSSSTVENCYNTGNVTGSYSYVGGVVGYSSSTVKNCYNTGFASGTNEYVGGVVGRSTSTVENCYNTGNVESTTMGQVGGIVGYSSSTISNCYNTGEVIGKSLYVGGIAGNSSSTVTDCYNLGDVSGTNTAVGGIVGNDSNVTVTDCYYNSDKITVSLSNTRGTALTSVEMTGDNALTNMSFETEYWTVPTATASDSESSTDYYYRYYYPVLIGNEQTENLAYYSMAYDFSGEGTEANPYQIATLDDLNRLATNVNEGETYAGVYFIQTADITITESDDYTPIGTGIDGDASYYFAGTYDAGIYDNDGICTDNYTIEGTINNKDSDYVGVFGYINGATIKNLNVSVAVTGASYVGGVVGYNAGTVTACTNQGTVEGTSYVGGIVGSNHMGNTLTFGTVTNCDNTGEVTGMSNVGGVLGCNGDYSSVTDCSNTGKVTATGDVTTTGDNVGGVVGYNGIYGKVTGCSNTGEVTGARNVGGVIGDNDTFGTVTSCSNTGEVTGESNVGGVIGYSDTSGTVTSCSNTGKVTATGDNVGGVIGYSDTSGTVNDCYNMGEVTGASNVGGVIGYNASKVSFCYNTGEVTGTSNVGGVIGVVGDDNETSSYVVEVAYCYNIGEVTGTSNVGGVIGSNSGKVEHCYYNTDIATDMDSIGETSGSSTNVEGKTTSQMTSYSFVTLISNQFSYKSSVIEEDHTKTAYYPYLIVFGEDTAVGVTVEISNTYDTWTDVAEAAVSGSDYAWTTESTALSIYTEAGLAWLAYQVNSGASFKDVTVTLETDLDLTTVGVSGYNLEVNSAGAYENLTAVNSWIPIGNDTNRFLGVFDGDGHTVSGVYINGTSLYQGLFGCIGSGIGITDDTTVKNLGVINSSITSSNDYVGAVVGSNRGTVENCYNTGDVSGYSYVGGVVGVNAGNNVSGTTVGGTVSNCYNTGDVTGSIEAGEYIGGVVGANASNAITTYCYNTGDIIGKSNVGGVVGNNASDAITTYCYNTGDIIGKSSSYVGSRNIGGVAGGNSSGSITYCYNTGDVIGNSSALTGSGSSYIGGVVGENDSGTITSCYNIGKVTGDSNIGGVVGYNRNATITGCYFNSETAGEGVTGVGYNTDDSTISVTALTSYEMTGTGTGRASEKMSDFDSDSYSAWTFTSDSADGTIGYYPILTDNEQDPIPSITLLSGSASIAGEQEYGSTLTADMTDSNASTFSYQWQRTVVDGDSTVTTEDISGATGSTYKLTVDDIGATITVVITADGYIGEKTATTEAIKTATLTVTSSDSSTTYTGSTISANVVTAATVDDATYTVEYSTDDGTYSATVPTFTDAGVYTISYKITADNHTEATGTYTCTITAKPLTISGTTVSAKTYDGNATGTATLGTVSGIATSDSTTKVTVTSATFDNKDVGTGKTVTVVYETTDTNYIAPVTETVTADITAKTITVTPSSDQGKCYGETDGTLTYAITGVIDEEVASFSGALSRETGDSIRDYAITIGTLALADNGAFDADNYSLVLDDTVVNYSITQKDITETVTDPTDWLSAATVTLTAPSGYTISSSDALTDNTWNGTITIATTEGKDVEYTYYLKVDDTGAISAEKTFTYSNDQTVPTAKITVGSKWWETLLETITFGIFSTSAVTVTIDSADTLSDVDTVYYSIQNELVSNTDTITNWIAYSSSSKPTLDKDNTYVVYAKVVDNADNETIISSDGVVIYTNSTVNTASFDFVKSTINTADVDVTVNTNGNTINEITLGTLTLIEDTDYTVGTEAEGVTIITLTNAYLQSLTRGANTFAVSYNPQGESYVEDVNNEKPTTTTFTANVYEIITDTTAEVQDSDYTGSAQSPTIQAATVDNEGLTIKYSNDNGTSYTLDTIPSYTDAGTYTIYYQLSADNHQTETGVITFTINKIQLTWSTDGTVEDKTYDGSTAATVDTAPTLVGVVSGDTAPVITVGTVTFVSENASDDAQAITATGYEVADHTNYIAPTSQPTFADASIEAKQLEVSGTTVSDKTYDGGTTGTATLGIVSGIEDGDATVVTVTSATFEDKNVGTGKKVTVVYATTDTNYIAPITETVTANITAKQLTVTGTTVSTKTYDGGTTGTATPGIVSGIEDGDTTTVTVTSATFDNKNVGTDKTVTVVYATTDTNYIAPVTETVKASITAKTITVTPDSNQSKYYGQADSTLTYTYSDAIGIEEASFTGTLTRVSGEDVGTYAISIGSEIGSLALADQEDSGFLASNYSLVLDEVTVTYAIKAYTTTAVATGNSDWSNEATLTLTAPDGYSISASDAFSNNTWGNTLTITTVEGASSAATYYLLATAGDDKDAITTAMTFTYNNDKTVPTVKINIGTKWWEELLETITFGVFSTSVETVTIEGDDDSSGVASVYYSIQNDLVPDIDTITDWEAYSSTSKPTLAKDNTYVVYAKVVDKAGNVTIINSNGVVVYTDSEAVTESFDFMKSSDDGVEITVNTYGNTVDAIICGSSELRAGTDYTTSVDGDVTTITFAASYLKGLSGGTYGFTISYNPMGEAYVADDGNVAPETTQVLANVYEVIEDTTEDQSHVYTAGDQAITAPTATTVGDVAYTVMYSTDGGETYTSSEVPSFKEVGTYEVYYEISAEKHESITGVLKFQITQAHSLVEVVTVEKDTDGHIVIKGVIVGTHGESPSGSVAIYDGDILLETVAVENDGDFQYIIIEVDDKDYSITAKFTSTDSNFTDGATEEAFEYDHDKWSQHIVFDEIESKTYGDDAFTLSITSQDDDGKYLDVNAADVTYVVSEDNGVVEIIDDTVTIIGTGKVTITATIKANNYYNGTSTTYILEVGKKAITVTPDSDQSKYYGQEDAGFTYSYTGYVDAGTPSITGSLVREDGEDIGTYDIQVGSLVLSSSEVNYELAFTTGVEYEIQAYETSDLATPTISANDNGWYSTSSIVLSAPAGYSISASDALSDNTWSDTLTITTIQAADATATYYLRATDGTDVDAISTAMTFTYSNDQTVATGTITIDQSTWSKFLETITFGIYQSSSLQVTITGSDTLSEIQSIAYYIADVAMTETSVGELADAVWTSYANAFAIDAEDATKVVVYAKLTDEAGNVSYVSTDGVVFDTTAPSVTGVANLGTYNTDLTIEVADANLSTVTLNGEAVDASITIAADEDATYVLVATDLAGNTTTYTFYTYVESVPLDDVLENLPTVDDSMTEEEKEAVQEEIKEVVNDLTESYLEELESYFEAVENGEETSKDEEIIIEEVNKLDEVLVEANDNISVVATTKVDEDDVEADYQAPEVEILPQGLAVAIYGSDTYEEAIAEGSDIELSLSVTQTDGDEDGLVFEIKPTISIGGGDAEVIPNTCINAPVTFNLYLNSSFKGSVASIEHVKEDGSSEFYENLPVYTDDNGYNYVTLTVYEFSNFIVSEYEYEVSVDGMVTEYKVGDTVTLTVPTKEGYEFTDWSSDDVEITDNTFLMPEQDVVITSTWKEVVDDTDPEGDDSEDGDSEDGDEDVVVPDSEDSDDGDSDDDDSDEEADEVVPDTGDSSNSGLLLIFMCGSLVGYWLVEIREKRCRN